MSQRERKPTLEEFAAKAGVGVSTAHRYHRGVKLKPSTRIKCDAAFRELFGPDAVVLTSDASAESAAFE